MTDKSPITAATRLTIIDRLLGELRDQLFACGVNLPIGIVLANQQDAQAVDWLMRKALDGAVHFKIVFPGESTEYLNAPMTIRPFASVGATTFCRIEGTDVAKLETVILDRKDDHSWIPDPAKLTAAQIRALRAACPPNPCIGAQDAMVLVDMGAAETAYGFFGLTEKGRMLCAQLGFKVYPGPPDEAPASAP